MTRSQFWYENEGVPHAVPFCSFAYSENFKFHIIQKLDGNAKGNPFQDDTGFEGSLLGCLSLLFCGVWFGDFELIASWWWQGIIDLAFSKPRTPMTPCFCLQIPEAHQARSSPPPISNLGLPPPAKQGKGKCTTASMLLEMIKDVETAISCRKGRSGTAAGDVAFPKGKENLASVLKRYKRRLSSKSVSSQEGVSGSRKSPTSAPYGS